MKQTFKPYTGTKTIKAMPMRVRHAANAGANVPQRYLDSTCASYDPGADGYLIEYDDGFRSWSPKKVFEATYKISETYADRMKIELTELNERICKATKALNNFGAIPENERGYLKEQIDAMQQYATILYDRIRFATEAHAATTDNTRFATSSDQTKKGGK